MTKRVLFLGAGYSAPFGHPVMDSFLEVADSSELLSDEQKSLLGRLTLNTRRANSFLESSPTNLEDILSYAVMSDRLGFSEDGSFGPQIKEILSTIYGTIEDYRKYWQEAGNFQDLLSNIYDKENDALSIVTTNYDLNVESSLFWAKERACLPFEYKQASVGQKKVVGTLYKENSIPLYKLHGSVNWFTDEGCEEITVMDQIGQAADWGQQDRSSLRPLATAKDTKLNDPPLIVPPSFLKPDLNRLLAKTWSGAAQRIADANEVIFIGYSFPPTDTEMAYFLAHAMANNPHLRRIAVVDPNVDTIMERLEVKEGRFGSHFKGLLQPYQSDWRTVDLTT